jgi:hypoxanthine phosphoribosyltransferase
MSEQEQKKINHESFMDIVNGLVLDIKNSNITYDFIVPIPRGGLIPSVYLSHFLDLPIMPLNCWSDALFSHKKMLEDKILFVDDVVDTSRTLEDNANIITPHCDVACLVLKPWARIIPKYYGLRCNKWVIFDWEKDFYF